jgi:hypothetical protein
MRCLAPEMNCRRIILPFHRLTTDEQESLASISLPYLRGSTDCTVVSRVESCIIRLPRGWLKRPTWPSMGDLTGQPHQALLVIDQAITSIQGRKNLYVLDERDTVQELPVSIGQLQSDGLRVVQGKGLDDKSRVVVSKLLQVRPKVQIQPVLQPMPTYSGAEPAPAAEPRAVKGTGKG